MNIIKNEIDSFKKQLKQLQEQSKKSFDSVKEYWKNSYHDSFTQKCEMIYHLVQGKVYEPYGFYNTDITLTRGKIWGTETLYDFHVMYNNKEGSSPIGFISLKSGLYYATTNNHKEMWIEAIKNKKEVRSFNDYQIHLKSNTDFLIEQFENFKKESSTGAYSNIPYMIEFEEKRLKTGKYYIYIENTSRRL